MESSANSHQCLGVVLAGGLSSRMGQSKAKLQRQQQDMLSFSKELLHHAGIDQVVTSGDHYQITDQFKQAGPLAGIYSVLKQCQPAAILALPVDLPLLTANELFKLRQVGELSQRACFYEHHYLPLYLPVSAQVTSVLDGLFNPFTGKGPSIRAFLEKLPHQAIKPTAPQRLMNTNTPQEWQQAMQQLTTSGKINVKHGI